MGQRTLVLGAYHYCWYDKCRYYDECVRQGRTAEYDRRCPVYEDKPDKDYYRLSNSNVIEIDSYIEGGHYPAYDAFTHKMSGIKKYVGSGVRAAFWDKVAFYNWIQHYLPEPQEDFQYRQWEEVFLRDLPAGGAGVDGHAKGVSGPALRYAWRYVDDACADYRNGFSGGVGLSRAVC